MKPVSTWSYSGSAGMEMKAMTMKMPAIRAILRDGGSTGRSSGSRSVCSGGADRVMLGFLRVGRRGPLGVDVPKAGREWEPQGPPRHVQAKLKATIHPYKLAGRAT